MAKRVWLLLLACACQGGSTVDLQLTSAPPTQLTQLTLELDTTGKVHHDEFVSDGGLVVLPATLRVLADGDMLTATAKGFDVDGGFRTATGSVSLSAGTATLPLDLSAVAWCPAGPLLPGELALMDESPDAGNNGYPFGYDNATFTLTNDPALACTGKQAGQYPITHQYDGMGISFPNPGTFRHLSFRIWASESSLWSFSLITQSDAQHPNGVGYTLPNPNVCTGDQIGCASTIGPAWQFIAFDVPSSIPVTVSLQMQDVSPSGAPVTARFDDVRVVPTNP